MIVDILLKEREKELNTMPRAKPLLILGQKLLSNHNNTQAEAGDNAMLQF